MKEEKSRNLLGGRKITQPSSDFELILNQHFDKCFISAKFASIKNLLPLSKDNEFRTITGGGSPSDNQTILVYFCLDHHFWVCERDNTDCSAYLEVFVVICTLPSDLGRANLCCKISLDWAAMSGERERAFAAPSLSASHFRLSCDKIFYQL